MTIKKYICAAALAVLTLVLISVGWAQLGQAKVEEALPVNAKPVVQWSDDAEQNQIYHEYATEFKVPYDYFLNGGGGFGDNIVMLTMPSFKPLSREEKDCRRFTTLNLSMSCIEGILSLIFEYDLNQQEFKDMKIDENNYLNYLFKEDARKFDIPNWSNDFRKGAPEFGLISYYGIQSLEDKNNRFQTNDYFFKMDDANNVLVEIGCAAKTLVYEAGEYREGEKWTNVVYCEHRFVIKPYKMSVVLTYERKYLPQWQTIQNNIVYLINEFHTAAQSK